MNRKVNKRRGISLITLVITIIVMGILATAVILSLNSSGIIDRAHKAKKDTNYSSAKEVVTLARADWDLMTDSEKAESGNSFSTYAENRLIGAGFNENGEDSYRVSDSGNVVIIPKGFVASIYEGEKKISEGLVIYETDLKTLESTEQEDAMKLYNQYVWIPVENISDFVRRDGYSDGSLQKIVSSAKATEPFNKEVTIEEETITLSKTNDLTGEHAEYEKMYNSVKKYGGFYIARYEAGDEIATGTYRQPGEDGKVVSKKDKVPYNQTPWGKSMVSTEPYDNPTFGSMDGAVELSRSVYPESSDYTVVSTLIYGVEWDAAIKFLSDVQNPDGIKSNIYIYDSTNMGWYGIINSPNEYHRTGIDLNGSKNKTKNIYDMAGNLGEWTMEAHLTDKRVVRGGDANYTGKFFPASIRMGYTTIQSASLLGFRVALYLK